MKAEYDFAADVERIAVELIKGEHARLSGATIFYVFRSEDFPDNLRTIARAKKIVGLNAFLIERRAGEQTGVFCVETVQPKWLALTALQKIAVTDHELTHFEFDELTGELALREHDIEEFPEVIERNGLYHPGLVTLAESIVVAGQATNNRAALLAQLYG